MGAQISYGDVPVPYTASWTSEERFFVARCVHAKAAAICQATSRGTGKPRFGKPHAIRQRETIARGLCDLCARPLAGRTKVSLSHARPFAHAAKMGDILQVEPLLHKRCAAISLKHCPALIRDTANGTLNVRQVTRYAVQMAVMSPEYVREVAGEDRKAVGHAKVQLLAWIDRDAEWLEAP
jgi:hypothetical protein